MFLLIFILIFIDNIYIYIYIISNLRELVSANERQSELAARVHVGCLWVSIRVLFERGGGSVTSECVAIRRHAWLRDKINGFYS